jgi:hypothetical protein
VSQDELAWLPTTTGTRLHHRVDAVGHPYGTALCSPTRGLWHPPVDLGMTRCARCLHLLERAAAA